MTSSAVRHRFLSAAIVAIALPLAALAQEWGDVEVTRDLLQTEGYCAVNVGDSCEQMSLGDCAIAADGQFVYDPADPDQCDVTSFCLACPDQDWLGCGDPCVWDEELEFCFPGPACPGGQAADSSEQIACCMMMTDGSEESYLYDSIDDCDFFGSQPEVANAWWETADDRDGDGLDPADAQVACFGEQVPGACCGYFGGEVTATTAFSDDECAGLAYDTDAEFYIYYSPSEVPDYDNEPGVGQADVDAVCEVVGACCTAFGGVAARETDCSEFMGGEYFGPQEDVDGQQPDRNNDFDLTDAEANSFCEGQPDVICCTGLKSTTALTETEGDCLAMEGTPYTQEDAVNNGWEGGIDNENLLPFCLQGVNSACCSADGSADSPVDGVCDDPEAEMRYGIRADDFAGQTAAQICGADLGLCCYDDVGVALQATTVEDCRDNWRGDFHDIGDTRNGITLELEEDGTIHDNLAEQFCAKPLNFACFTTTQTCPTGLPEATTPDEFYEVCVREAGNYVAREEVGSDERCPTFVGADDIEGNLQGSALGAQTFAQVKCTYFDVDGMEQCSDEDLETCVDMLQGRAAPSCLNIQCGNGIVEEPETCDCSSENFDGSFATGKDGSGGRSKYSSQEFCANGGLAYVGNGTQSPCSDSCMIEKNVYYCGDNVDLPETDSEDESLRRDRLSMYGDSEADACQNVGWDCNDTSETPQLYTLLEVDYFNGSPESFAPLFGEDGMKRSFAKACGVTLPLAVEIEGVCQIEEFTFGQGPDGVAQLDPVDPEVELSDIEAFFGSAEGINNCFDTQALESQSN